MRLTDVKKLAFYEINGSEKNSYFMRLTEMKREFCHDQNEHDDNGCFYRRCYCGRNEGGAALITIPKTIPNKDEP